MPTIPTAAVAADPTPHSGGLTVRPASWCRRAVNLRVLSDIVIIHYNTVLRRGRHRGGRYYIRYNDNNCYSRHSPIF